MSDVIFLAITVVVFPGKPGADIDLSALNEAINAYPLHYFRCDFSGLISLPHFGAFET